MHDEEKKLADVHPDETFKAHSGQEIKNLKQLLHLLSEISEESFQKHVKDGKNDFAEWIRHSVDDEELADMLSDITEFDKTKKIVKDRINLLEKRIEVKNIKQSLETLKSDSMGIEEETDIKSPIELDESPLDAPSEAPAGPDLAPAAPPNNFLVKEEHPFEHLKSGLRETIIHILIGIIIGLIIGYFIGTYL